jgi:photosystem II stability/assembly factor-like uncharacterized protein
MRKTVGLLLLGLGVLFSIPQWAGAQWVRAGKPGGRWITALVVHGPNLFAARRKGGVFLSTNKGVSWKPVNTGLPKEADFQCLAVNGANLFVGTVGQGVFLSTDNGTGWMAVNSGLPKECSVWRLEVSGPNLFAVAGAERASVFLSEDNGLSWKQANAGLPDTEVLCLAACETNLFAGTGTPPIGKDACVFLSTDNGASWKAANAGLPADNPVLRFAVLGKKLFAGGWHSGRVFRSESSGATWTPVCFGLPDPMDFSLSDLAVSGSKLFLASFKGIFVSVNEGASWTVINSGLPAEASVYCLAVGETDLFAGTEEGEVWRLSLSDVPIAANLSDPILSKENWALIHRDNPKAVFIPSHIKTIMQEGFATRQGRQDIPFIKFRYLFLPALQMYGNAFLFNKSGNVVVMLPKKVYMANDFLQAVLLFKVKNADLGYAAKSPVSAPELQEAPPQPGRILKVRLNIFIEFRQTDASGTSRVVQEVFVPAPVEEDSGTYNPDNENWYSVDYTLRPGKYTVVVAITSEDLKKVGIGYLDIDLPGPESYRTALETTSIFFVNDVEKIDVRETAPMLHKNAFTFSENKIVPNIDSVLPPGEELRIFYCVLGAKPKVGGVRKGEIDIEAAYEVRQEDETMAISWEARNYNLPGINEVLPWEPATMTWDDKGGREVRGDLTPGKYTLVIKVKDKVSGATVEKRVPFEVKEKQ